MPTPPQSEELRGQASFAAYVQAAKAQADYQRILQTQVRLLRDAGESWDKISERLKKAGVEADAASKAMQSYYRSLSELSKLGVNDFFTDFKNNMVSLGRATAPLLTLGTLVQTFRALDAVGSSVNRTLLTLTAQTGNLLPIGLRSGQSAQGLQQSIFGLSRLGYSPDQAGQIISQFATQLPRSMVKGGAPKFAEAAAGLANVFQTDVGQTTALMSDLVRRGVTSGTSLVGVFEKLNNTSRKTDMSLDMTVKTFNELWPSIRQFGGSTADARGLMERFGTAIKSGVLTIGEVAGLHNKMQEMPIQSLMGLASMSAGMKGSSKVFGTSSDPMEQVGFFLRNRGRSGMTEDFNSLALSVINSQAGVMAGPGASADKLAAMRDLMRSQLGPALGFGLGRNETERVSSGLGLKTLLGGGVPGLEGGGRGGDDIVEASKRYVEQARENVTWTTTLTESFGRLATSLKVTASALLSGDVGFGSAMSMLMGAGGDFASSAGGKASRMAAGAVSSVVAPGAIQVALPLAMLIDPASIAEAAERVSEMTKIALSSELKKVFTEARNKSGRR